MTKEESEDTIVAAGLNVPPDAVRHARQSWNDNRIMKAVFAHRIQRKIRECQQALESIEPAELKAKQAELLAYKYLANELTKTET